MKKPRDTKSPDSVLKRLSNQRVVGQSVENAQVLFVLERFLARVAESRYRDQLVLKGGILLYFLTRQWNRPTEDLDFLAIRLSSDSMDSVLREILGIDVGDRLEFLADLMTWQDIREDTGYPCRRYTIPFRFGPKHSRSIKLDLSFGDPITPGPSLVEIHPILEGFQGGLVQGYPVETFLAEKVETVLVRGLATTRAKDIFDLWVISRVGKDLHLNMVAEALKVTADYRDGVAGRTVSVRRMDASVLEPGYGTDPNLRRIWDSYVRSRHIVTPLFGDVVSEVQAFIRPMVERSLGTGPELSWDPVRKLWS
ncbi:nucleotidyl transferase AbiEii/AbiGii toxin family protein [Holophaga foetida]|uniref:nucleotidyl transferase AbiEii/AbiGii toxin family protein n=1 Tax=Holophaga foetida TaxID=35839 RepID=UPI000247531D|nr:nucleotidyl transferase AbiEii/AbiGii toxin family protein [Holophaga foetida]